MFISKNNNIKDIEEIYTAITRLYLDSLVTVLDKDDLEKFKNNSYLISEGYRNSLCLALGLDSEASTQVVKKYENEFKAILLPVCEKYKLRRLDAGKRKGVLESCVHCIEKSRKLVSY